MNRKRFFSREHGQSLIEVALSFTIVVFLLSGVIEFGIAFFQFVQMQDAAQEGATYGSIKPNEEDRMRQRILAVVNDPFDLGITNTNITITDDGARCAGHALTVTITYDHPVTMALITSITGPTIPLRASATSTILTPLCP